MSKPYKKPAELHFWRKLGLQIGVIVVAVGLLGAGSYFGYRAWRESSLLKEARGHLAKNDFASAMLTARRLIELDPAHLEANRIAAEASDRAEHPDAVAWRQRVNQLEPKDPETGLAWARTAVKFGQFPSAQAALDVVPKEAHSTPGYQQLAGGVAVGMGRPAEAGKFYAEALRLEPASEQNRFNHANWTAQFDKDAGRRKAAEGELITLTQSPKLGIHAHRALLNLSVETKRWDEAKRHGVVLTGRPAATPADWALYLRTLDALKDGSIESELARAQGAADEPLKVVVVLQWMNDHGRAGKAVEWAGGLKPEILASPNVAVALADSYDASSQWEKLLAHARKGDWKDKEFLRNAYVARAHRQLGDLGNSGSNWSVAVMQARTPEKANQLVLRVGQWGWKMEALELLWKMTEGPNAAWALGALNRLYQNDLNTKGLLRVAMELSKLEPGNSAAGNNVAALSLLLGENLEGATKLAAELFAKHPKSIGIASTHALALYKNGKAEEALKVLEAFKPEELRHPGIASTYGVVLAALGRPEAREVLEIADKAPLLPEERALVAKGLGR